MDTRDTAANSELNALLQSAGTSLSRLTNVIVNIPDTGWVRLTRDLPAPAGYGFAREQARRQGPPRALPGSPLVDSLLRIANTWGPSQFSATLASIDFGRVDAPEGPLDVRTQSGAISNHPVRRVREAGMRANWTGFNTERDSFALILTRTAEARTRLARLGGYASHTEESYGRSYLSLLSRGHDAPPPELLRRSVGIDLARPAILVREAGSIIGRWRAELETLYQRP